MDNLKELFVHELEDMHYAEKRLVEALGEVASKVGERELQRAFKQHKRETQVHVKRLNQVFKMVGVRPQDEVCQGIEGLVKEWKKFTREKPSAEVLDLFTIGAQQKVENYEITAYENIIKMAGELGLQEAVQILTETLNEERQTLEKLKGFGNEFDMTRVSQQETGGEESYEMVGSGEEGSMSGRGGRRGRRTTSRSTGSRGGRSSSRSTSRRTQGSRTRSRR
ncbi:MAG TPA: DUF892 family protein [Planctomycetota bacterium]|nr:DUF892 family protein [Planctomycetota bacterium]